MDKVIKEGTLRVLISESTCDVILSCKGHRLMAHKLILSIASPVFRELLQKNSLESTSVIILPDISGAVMSTILDYIYTGTTVVYSHSLQEFLSAARFLNISLDSQNVDSLMEIAKQEDVKKIDLELIKTDIKTPDELPTSESSEETPVEENSNPVSGSDILSLRSHKKLPDILPLNFKISRKKAKQKICKVVVPSPWCARKDRSFMGDPRSVSLGSPDKNDPILQAEDTNNNFQPSTQIREAPKPTSKSLDSIIRHLYLNTLENSENTGKEAKSSPNPILLKSLCGIGERTSVPDISSQKEIMKSLTIPEPTNFSFSRRFGINDVSSKSKSTETRDRDFENIQNKIPSLDLTQNLRLSNQRSRLHQPSPTNLPPSPVTHLYSPTILNIPIISPINRADALLGGNQGVSNTSELCGKSCDNENCDDNSVDNLVGHDSSNDEKKEEESSKKKKVYKCTDCDKTFSQLRNYKYHRSVHEGTKEFSAKCPECGKMFNDRGYLSSHMKIHRDKKEYACSHCPKRFNQRVAYNMHLRIHTGVKPHTCPTCGKSFSRKMLLKQHQRVHTGERPYTCPECGKSFADRSNMSLHARLHTGVKPYACTVCPKSFTKKHHLKTHMNFHTGLKPYTCENCGLAFSQSSNMRTHYKKCILKEETGKLRIVESISSSENNSS